MSIFSKKRIMILTLFMSMVFIVEAQSNKGLQLDLSATPFLNSFGTNSYSSSFNLGVFYPVSESLTCGILFKETSEFDKANKDYDALSSIGVGVGYVFFEGEQECFWANGRFEILADVGGGLSNFTDEKAYLYIDLSCRAYIKKIAFVSVVYNYKLYEKGTDDTSGLYAGFGIRF